MTKEEMKNKISMALKDPILQQGFEIICKNLAELEKENEQLKEQTDKMKCCGNCKHFKEYNEYTDNVYYACELEECDNLDNWEVEE